MDIKNIGNVGNTNYDPFLVEALNIGKKDTTHIENKIDTSQNSERTPERWQQEILLDALDALENNIQVDDKSPLFSENAAPIEDYQEALLELRELISNDFEKFAAQAQANLTPGDILYLFEDQMDIMA